ncbi:MAG TPA: hypothetical protein V6D33_17950 [Cyanophyceae cyanobacterium]
MNTLNECLCCSEQLLRHIRQGQIYWFCRHCRQEMPSLVLAMTSPYKTVQSRASIASALDLA